MYIILQNPTFVNTFYKFCGSLFFSPFLPQPIYEAAPSVSLGVKITEAKIGIYINAKCEARNAKLIYRLELTVKLGFNGETKPEQKIHRK